MKMLPVGECQTVTLTPALSRNQEANWVSRELLIGLINKCITHLNQNICSCFFFFSWHEKVNSHTRPVELCEFIFLFLIIRSFKLLLFALFCSNCAPDDVGNESMSLMTSAD